MPEGPGCGLFASVVEPPALDQVLEAAEPAPEGLDAGLAVALAAEKPAKFGDPAHGSASIGRLGRWDGGAQMVAAQDVPLIVREEGRAGYRRAGASNEINAQDAPSHDHVNRQGAP